MTAARRPRAVLAMHTDRVHRLITPDTMARITQVADLDPALVAEYTLAAILFANKQVLRLSSAYRDQRRGLDWLGGDAVGNYRRTVGIVGASQIGRLVLELLRPQAVIDVTTPDVLPADSPLYDLPNVLLTPHVAGEPFAHPVLWAEFHRTA